MGSIARRRAHPVRPGAADPAQALHVETADGRLTASGYLDGRSAHLLHDGVSSLLQSGPSHWTLDATWLVVGDDTGLRALVGCYQRALRHGRVVTLHGASPALRSALGRLRLDVHLLPPASEPGTSGRPARPAGDRGGDRRDS